MFLPIPFTSELASSVNFLSPRIDIKATPGGEVQYLIEDGGDERGVVSLWALGVGIHPLLQQRHRAAYVSFLCDQETFHLTKPGIHGGNV